MTMAVPVAALPTGNFADSIRRPNDAVNVTARVEHGVFDAIVGGESAYPDFGDALFAQQPGEVRAVESRVSISACFSSF